MIGKILRCQFAILVSALILLASFTADARTNHKHYPRQGGRYAGSYGSPHKHGHYVNPRTGNHYTRHPR